MLLEAFLQQCRQQADAPAVYEQERHLSYGELLKQAQNVAIALQTKGIQPGQPVAIHLERGIEATIAVFGILLAGACYVPLDLKNPVQRLAFIINDAQVKQVVGLGQVPDWLDKDLWLTIDKPFEDQISKPKPPLQMEVIGVRGIKKTNLKGHDASNNKAQITSIAAILYTSGSTGQPRGVAIRHGAIAAFANWAAELVNLQAKDRIASTTPFFFDLSTFDLYAVLSRGASLYFVPAALTMAPARLSAWLKENQITGWYTVPSLLAFLAYKGNLGQTVLSSLRFLFFAGEVFPTPALITLADSLPQAALYNFFGPTETNVCCYWPVQRKQLQTDKSIPIGQPAANNELYIHPETGELWVRGPTLASGYWSNGCLRPFLNPDNWYATGDRVSFENGDHRFHGRLGRMLKCSGYRVEPAEIEAVVNAIEGVEDCAVIGVPDPTAGQRPALVLCINSELTISTIRQNLLRLLPNYMQPNRYLVLEKLPRLPNGKLDYQALKNLLNV